MAEKEEEGLLSLADSSNVKNKANKYFELWLEKNDKMQNFDHCNQRKTVVCGLFLLLNSDIVCIKKKTSPALWCVKTRDLEEEFPQIREFTSEPTTTTTILNPNCNFPP